MKRQILLSAIVLITIRVISIGIFQSQRTVASLPEEPRPPSYPFEENRALAQKELDYWLEHLPPIRYTEFGFTNWEETKRTTLGTPYIAYGFDPYVMAAPDYQSGNLREKLDGGAAMIFPILVDGRGIGIVGVGYRDGRWETSIGWGGQVTGEGQVTIVELQKQLVAKGITERVDDVFFFSYNIGSSFGIIDYQGQIWLIPYQDPGKHFPSLDFSGERMYILDEVLPLVHEQAKLVIEESDRRTLEEQRNPPPTSDPNQPTLELPTELPTPEPGPPTTATPELTLDPNRATPTPGFSATVLTAP